MPKSKRSKTNSRVVPFARGFRAATSKQQKDAIGKAHSLPEYDTSEEFFQRIPKCTSIDDWLAQYAERSQTFTDFVCECPWLSRRKHTNVKQDFNANGKVLSDKYPDGKIYILPLGSFETGGSPDLEALVEYTHCFFSLPVDVLPPVKLEYADSNIYWIQAEADGAVKKERLSSRYNAANGRRQLRVDAGLSKLREYLPTDALCMIALTMCDLFEAKSDLFVAGMAAGSYRAAIFSLHRYDPNMTFSTEFWHDISTNNKYTAEERSRMVLLRSCRLLVHEVNHLFGVGHCTFFNCCMNGAGHLAEDFRQPMFLCPVDLRKLQHLTGCDIVQRYRNLQAFFKKHGMKEEERWTNRRIEYILKQCSNEAVCINDVSGH